ncbi:hypothetical protein DFH11DRAFT_1730272 [Phellopilus nigrolimitatus]|nr:hypothetical protein DFH11DRAFT_1730272 [Phellopilus nigrolimitatus]
MPAVRRVWPLQGRQVCREVGHWTVCNRCRKKVKRVERRGTLDSSQSALAHSAGQIQYASVGRTRATARQDTLLVNHHAECAQAQSQMLSPRPVSHYLEHERDQDSRGCSSRSHSGSAVSAYTSAVASGKLYPAESAHLGQGQAYSSAATSLYASGLASQNALRRPAETASNQLHLPARAPAPRAVCRSGGGETGSRGSSVNEEDLLDSDDDGNVEKDALLDGEGEGEDDVDIDADIARAANGPSSSLSSLAKLQIQSPLKTMQLNYPALSARQYHDIHPPGINALAGVTASARENRESACQCRCPQLPLWTTHAVSREYHTSRGSGHGFDGDADRDLPGCGSGGGGDVDADGERDDKGAQDSGEGDADTDAEMVDAVDSAMRMDD